MADTRKPVGADEVRQWAIDRNWTDDNGRSVGDRGRFPTTLVAAYEKAHRSKRYVPGYRPESESATTRKAPAKAVATASRNSTPAKATPAPRQATKPESVRVDSVREDRVNGDDQGLMSVADAISMLSSAANTRKGGKPALITIQTLVNV